MSALAEAVASVLGTDTSKAEARAGSVASQLDAAKAKLAKGERHLAETNDALSRAVETGEGDVEKLSSASVKAEEDLRPLRRAVESLVQAKVAADEAVARVNARAERDALEAELGTLEAAAASGLADFERALPRLSGALSQLSSADAAAKRIRARLGLPSVVPIEAGLTGALRRLHESLVAKHADPHGRGIGAHPIEVPIHNVEPNAPTARRLGIV